ncbi:MAG: N-acetylmuramic acid 6-phosphate etherase [Bacteroidota bacterium]|nr:N-acetylmuramic acid 6-phosphate etherase [Bacteroidota bacterium]MEE3097840.1 N-acetylmuramic acid 6-phosphate etherase [Bacteroidota bacterium]|tara:strand:+ start:826 stop:1635 length:810 start_codon:yes stop_codon:yes gene_type:complete
MNFNKITESDSLHQNLDLLDTIDLLHGINNEDQKVAKAVQLIIPDIEKFINSAYKNMEKGGRLFYIGAGTSGRLGIVDASECPPTFGVDHDLVVGLIAGGDSAIRKAVEFAEDDSDQGWLDLEEHNIDHNDTVVGIAASGTTPYVVGALKQCNSNQILTAGITCNPGSPLAIEAQHAIVPIVGPEFVTGSTRMKSGTAQKLVLNMISTSLMIKLGRVKGNKMVDMQLSNNKLVNRGEKMIMETLHINQQEAKDLLKKYGSVRKAIQSKD